MCLAVGSIDPLYLFGEGAEAGGEVPAEGFGRVLVSCGGEHCWVGNEIKGVTDDIGLTGKGKGFRVVDGGEE